MFLENYGSDQEELGTRSPELAEHEQKESIASCTWCAALVELIGPEPIGPVRTEVDWSVFWTKFSIIFILFHTYTSCIHIIPNFLPNKFGYAFEYP